MNYKILMIILLSFLSIGTTAQSSKADLTNDELLINRELNSTEILGQFEKRYADTQDSGSLDDKIEQAKFVAISSYKAAKLDVTDSWIQKVDSLQSGKQNITYDRRFEFLRITLAQANKNVAHAIDLLDKMKPFVEESNDPKWKILYHVKLAKSYAGFDDLALALKNILAAELLNQDFKGRLEEALILDAKAGAAREKRDIEATLDYQLQATEIFEELDSHTNLFASYSNVIYNAKKLKRNNIVDKYLNKLSLLRKELGCDGCFFSNELNRIFFYIQSADYNKAISLSNRMINYADSTKRDKSHSIYLKGIAYRGLDQYDKAEIYLKQAFDLGKDMAHSGKCAFYSHALYQTYYWKDKYEPALEWFQMHTSYRDSVYNEKKAKEIAVYEARLESLEQKQKVIELEAEIKVDRQKKRILWLSIFFGALLSFALLYGQRQRARKQKVLQDAKLIAANSEREKLEQLLEFKQREIASQ